MKRFASLMIFIMLASILVACGGGENGAGTSATTGGTSASPATSAAPAASAPDASASPAASTSPEASASAAAAASPAASAEPTAVSLGSGGQKVVIWHQWGGSYLEAISAQLGQYAQQNNVTLELLNVPDLNQKVNVAVPAGQGPDIIAWVNDQIGKNALTEVIQPLDDKGIDKAYLDQNFIGTAVNAMTFEDQIWGVPESMEAIALFYNKDLVKEEELPKNTDELFQKAQAFNQANQGSYYFVYQARSANGEPYFNAPWWYGYGAQYVAEDGTVGLDSPESIKAGQFFQKFSTIMPKEVDADVARSLFTEGKAAIWMTGPWATADVQKANINFGVAPIPTISETNQPAKPFVGVKTMMLAAGAKNEEGALALMKHYGGTEFQAALAQANKQVPANKAAQDQVKNDPIIAAFVQQTANGVPLPNTPYMDALWGPAGEAQNAIWTGSQPIEEALKAGAEAARTTVATIKGE
jgi:arabinogalactan oligomer/maltooligosaccharide transport system substrate-binding protein